MQNNKKSLAYVPQICLSIPKRISGFLLVSFQKIVSHPSLLKGYIGDQELGYHKILDFQDFLSYLALNWSF